jgi:hypothetical protein
MPTIWLGNHQAVDRVATGEVDERGEPVRERIPQDGKRYTIVEPPDGTPVTEIITTINDLWPLHSDADAPAWVASTESALTQVLAGMWGCEAREPEPITADAEAALSQLRAKAEER